MGPLTDALDDLQEPGSTMVLTEEGWQDADFQVPSDDWRALPDGSYESPDGRIRSWPLASPAGDVPPLDASTRS